MKTKTKILNFFGGPGVGKSTAAAGVFAHMKEHDYSVEYVSEYAKELTWEKNIPLLQNQIHVFAEQLRRQWRLINQVDYIITDSPLLLSSIYFQYYAQSEKISLFTEEYQQLAVDYFDQTFLQFNNVNFMIKRNKPYKSTGRNQKEDEARVIDGLILDKLYSVSGFNDFILTDSLSAKHDAIEFIKKQEE